MIKTTRTQEPKAGLAMHGTNVAFTTARAVTSHLRKRYRDAYHGRYRFARLVFTFDLTLLALALGLLVLNISLFTQPLFSRPIGLDLTLRTGSLVAATVVPVEAVIRPTDGKTHDEVHLFWHLPPEVEIVRADPPLTNSGSIPLGRIVPGEERTSRLYVRIRSLPQTSIAFSFSIHDGIGLRERVVTGGELRPVLKSALTARPAIQAQEVVAGGSIPIIVSNDSDLMAPAVIVRLTAKDGAPNSRLAEDGQARIGDMKPKERRIIFIDVDPNATGRVEFAWEVQDASRPVSIHKFNLDVADSVPVTINEPLRSTPGAESTEIDVESRRAARLWVFHPLQQTVDDAVDRVYDLAAGTGRVHIPLRSDIRTTDTSWSVIPFEVRDGKTVIGTRTIGALSTAFPFSAAARYYATTGDQLGVGPLPPKVGDITSYWVVWTVGPTDADLKDVTFSTTLGGGVSATGKFASQTPGTFSADGSTVTWTIPSLPVTGDTPATFAFEIRYRPPASDRGEIPVLVHDSTASAVEVRSGLTLRADAPEQDTNLFFDLQARGKGTVE